MSLRKEGQGDPAEGVDCLFPLLHTHLYSTQGPIPYSSNPSTTMSSDQGRVNPNLPGSYQPVMNQDNFNAPSHHLSTKQQEQVAELAEASAGHTHTGGSSGGAGGFGSGSLGSEFSVLRSKGQQPAVLRFALAAITDHSRIMYIHRHQQHKSRRHPHLNRRPVWTTGSSRPVRVQ